MVWSIIEIFYFKGYTGGKWFEDIGGPANYVCMPEDPQWAKYRDGFQCTNTQAKTLMHIQSQA